MEKMSKSKKIEMIAIAAFAVVLLVGYRVYDRIFPYARPLEYPRDYPDVSEVVSVTISTPDGESTDVSNFASLIMQIQQGQPTRTVSVNDFPAAEFYYQIVAATSDKEYCYFVYQEDGQVFLEIPYCGIYKGLYNSGSSSLMEIIPDLIENHPVK